jgi:2-aminoadipate transaminase
VTVPADDDGLMVDGLEEALRAAPKFLYVLPNFQNPSGATLGLARRRRVVELATRYGTPVVEDDPYGQLRYEGEHLPPLVKLDADLHGCAHGERSFRGGVLYVGTMSKTLAPGLRVGWVVAPELVIGKLAVLKQGADLHTSTFAQMVACEAAQGGFLDRHVRLVRRVYTERRDAMLRALERHAPEGVRWSRPQGGLFLWVTLPPPLDAAALLRGRPQGRRRVHPRHVVPRAGRRGPHPEAQLLLLPPGSDRGGSRAWARCSAATCPLSRPSSRSPRSRAPTSLPRPPARSRRRQPPPTPDALASRATACAMPADTRRRSLT